MAVKLAGVTVTLRELNNGEVLLEVPGRLTDYEKKIVKAFVAQCRKRQCALCDADFCIHIWES